MFTKNFKRDYVALGESLQPALPASKAKQSIELLERLGLVKETSAGYLKPTSITLRKDSAFKSLHLAVFLKTNMELAMEALESLPKEARDISALTLSLSEKGLKEAKDEIRALRKKLLKLADNDAKPEKVYQCNFQVFPVSK